MNTIFKRVAAITATTMLATGVAVLGATSASATPPGLGTVDFSPSSGALTATPNLNTTTGCPVNDGGSPAVATNNARAVINGPGWSNITIVGNTSSGVVHGGAQSFPIADSWDGIKLGNGLPALNGLYDVTLYCQNATGTVVSGTFARQLFFDPAGSGSYAQVSTNTTTISVSPSAASSTVGANVTLTATVTAVPLGGSVQFKNGVANLGSVQTVAASGTSAALTVNNLPLGANSVTAVFTPTNAAPPAAQYSASTSAPVTVTITKATATATLTASPASPNIFTPVTLSASVSGASGTPTGSVTFTYSVPGGSSTTSAPIALSGGSASLSLGALSAGTLSGLSVDYAGDATYNTASGTASDVTVVASDPTKIATEFIRTTVDAGALTITVQGFTAPSPSTPTGTPVGSPTYPYTVPTSGATNIVILPAANVNSTGTYIVTTGNILPVQVVDTRAGDPGYHVDGLLSDFVGATPSHKINAANVGWTPKFISSLRVPAATTAAGAGLVDGGVIAPANGLAAGSASNLGLALTAKTLFTAPAGAGTGTVFYGALLSLQAPTFTAADDYQATLTLTAV